MALNSVAIERRGWRLAPGVVLFVLGLTFAIVRAVPLGSVGALRVGAPWLMIDFRHVVYYPTRAFLEGMNPYDRSSYMARFPVDVGTSPYAPATLLLFTPFALLPLGPASVAYFLFTVVLTVVLAAVALRLSGWPTTLSSILAVAGLLLLSRPGHWNLLSGQVTLIVVLATYCALVLGRRVPRLAGVGLAIALLKPSFGLPLIPALLARRATRSVAWGLGVTAALNVPILLILIARAGGVASFFTTVLQSFHAFASNTDSHPIYGIWRVDLTACISRLLDRPLGTSVGFLVTALVLLPVIVISRRMAESELQNQQRVIDGLACCAILLSLFHQAYDLLLLTMPAATLARTVYLGAPSPNQSGQALLFGVLGLNYITTHSALAALRLTDWQTLIVVTANGLALTGLFVLYLAEAKRLQPLR